MTMARFNDEIKTQGLRDILQGLKTMAFVSGLWAEATNVNKIKTVTNTISYMIDGVLYTKSPTDDIVPTTCAIQPAAKRCRYLITLNAAGTVTVTKGTQVDSLTTGAIATLAWDAVQKKLVSSANSLSSFKAKDLILVSGFTSLENNGVFTVEEVGPLGAWIKVRENGMVDEVEGDNVTVLRESPLPECPAKQCPSGIMTITTGTTSFTVGTQDITNDIGTGSVAFTNIGAMPTEGITQ
jgi:hypothetical protein